MNVKVTSSWYPAVRSCPSVCFRQGARTPFEQCCLEPLFDALTVLHNWAAFPLIPVCPFLSKVFVLFVISVILPDVFRILLCLVGQKQSNLGNLLHKTGTQCVLHSSKVIAVADTEEPPSPQAPFELALLIPTCLTSPSHGHALSNIHHSCNPPPPRPKFSFTVDLQLHYFLMVPSIVVMISVKFISFFMDVAT